MYNIYTKERRMKEGRIMKTTSKMQIYHPKRVPFVDKIFTYNFSDCMCRGKSE